MKLLKKAGFLFLMAMIPFLIAGKGLISVNKIDSKKDISLFTAVPTAQYDGDDEEEDLPQEDEDSADGAKESGDENMDDNSVDEYNYGDED